MTPSVRSRGAAGRVILEAFAGPGGASLGIRSLGLEAVGIEWDRDACATRVAAGLPTIRADVRQVTELAPHKHMEDEG